MSNILEIVAIAFYVISGIYFWAKFYLNRKTRTIAFLFLLLGFATHALDLVVFGMEHHRFPAATLVEAFSFVTWLMLLALLVFFRRNQMDAAAVVLLPITIISVLIAVFYRNGEQAMNPILKGGWIYVHIPLMILSVACLGISFVMAVMYLLQEKQLKSKHPAFFFQRLPSLEACEELTYRSLWVGFFLLTFGIITGMIWSKYLRGVFWSWDYKEIWSAATWMLYAVLIHGRMLSSWRGRKAAYLTILGFVLILFTFAGVSFFFKSYHSF